MTDLHRVDAFVRRKLIPILPETERISNVFRRKLIEEVDELGTAQGDREIAEEWADCYIALLALGRALGVTQSRAFAEKMAVNESKDWRYDVGLGVFKRVK